MFEPSECFCWVWGLILNVISPLLPSCWVFSSWMWGISSHFLQHHATWKRSVLIPIPKTRNVKECSNYHTTALISHASKVMLKILQARFQQNMNRELTDVQPGFRKGRGTRQVKDHQKTREFQKNTYSALLTMPKPLIACITVNCGKFLKLWEYHTTLPGS